MHENHGIMDIDTLPHAKTIPKQSQNNHVDNIRDFREKMIWEKEYQRKFFIKPHPIHVQ